MSDWKRRSVDGDTFFLPVIASTRIASIVAKRVRRKLPTSTETYVHAAFVCSMKYVSPEREHQERHPRLLRMLLLTCLSQQLVAAVAVKMIRIPRRIFRASVTDLNLSLRNHLNTDFAVDRTSIIRGSPNLFSLPMKMDREQTRSFDPCDRRLHAVLAE